MNDPEDGTQDLPQAERLVKAALAGLGTDATDPMPDDVAARLDAFVAGLAQQNQAVTATASHQVPPAAVVGDVLPLRAQRRPTTRWVLSGLAGAAAVLMAFVLLPGALPDSDGEIGSATTASDAGPQAAPESGKNVVMTASGTAYSASAVAKQAKALLSRVVKPTSTGQSAARNSGFPDMDFDSCLEELTGGADQKALAADAGTFGGRQAVLIALATEGDDLMADIWVVEPECRVGDARLLTFARIAI